jgi:hypothetical protein
MSARSTPSNGPISSVAQPLGSSSVKMAVSHLEGINVGTGETVQGRTLSVHGRTRNPER